MQNNPPPSVIIAQNEPALVSRDQIFWRKINWNKADGERQPLRKCEKNQIGYLLLCAQNHIESARERATGFGISDSEFDQIIKDVVHQVSHDGYAVQLNPVSFLATDIVGTPEIKDLLKEAIKKTPGCLRLYYLHDLEFANLQGAFLEGADMQRTWISNTDLRGAILNGANLQKASLPGIKLDGASLRGTNLCGAILFGSSLAEANLEGADLRNALVDYYNRGRTNWEKSNLWGADLCRAELIGCLLKGSDLSLTDVSGAKFTENLCYGVKWSLAFYNESNPPIDLGVNKDKLLALDEESYENAKRLQKAYRESLKSSDNDTIEKAKNEFKDFLSNIAYQKYKENPRQYIESHNGITDLPWDPKKNRFEYFFVKGVSAGVRNAKYGDDNTLKTLSNVLELGNRVLQTFGLNRYR
ncbi:MAG: pentapeptide repeat-containing protein [Alphaproteobacteria bacterium]|nr:pentapeptide repeat-containing protein [Alphaproteobacteria bacterium]